MFDTSMKYQIRKSGVNIEEEITFRSNYAPFDNSLHWKILTLSTESLLAILTP